MAAERGVRDWELPPELGWVTQRDAGVFGAARPPLFADPWGVLEAPGGPVSVAVLADVPPGESTPDGGGAALAPTTADRRPPTLLLERRALTMSAGRTRTRLKERPPADPGEPAPPGHRVVGSPHGPVVLLSSRPWGGPSGPDVRVVALLVPSGSSDALVLTLTWDDEHGLDRLEQLAEAVVAGLRIELEESRTPGTPSAVAGSRPTSGGPASGETYPPARWVGTRTDGRWGSVAAWLTGVVRLLFGPRRFRRATWTAWLTTVALVAFFGSDGAAPVGLVLLVLAFALCLVMPALLVWRSWTVMHGLVTDPRADDLATAGGRSGIVAYLVSAIALGALVLATGLDGAPAWYVAAGWLYVTMHVALLALEAGRPLAPAVRSRLTQDAR